MKRNPRAPQGPRLGHRGDGVQRRPHLCQHLVQPLQGPVQVHLNPAGGASDILTVVLRSPALWNEAGIRSAEEH